MNICKHGYPAKICSKACEAETYHYEVLSEGGEVMARFKDKESAEEWAEEVEEASSVRYRS